MCKESQKAKGLEIQNEIPCTQGQEMESLQSAIIGEAATNAQKSLFDFDDDEILNNSDDFGINFVQEEIARYLQQVTQTREQKQRCNVLEWWKTNKLLFPCLYKAAQAYLHIPATSVPAEIIFSLAGHIVRKRRSNISSSNVNKFIFLHKNKPHIPPETTVFTDSQFTDSQATQASQSV